jgi:hypothetical protein
MMSRETVFVTFIWIEEAACDYDARFSAGVRSNLDHFELRLPILTVLAPVAAKNPVIRDTLVPWGTQR